MIAPIDIDCPACKSTPGNYCTSATTDPVRPLLPFHHAERVDEALRAITRRRDDPRALRDALREAIDRLAKYQAADDLSFVITIRETFGL